MNKKKFPFEIRIRLQSYNNSSILVLKERLKRFAINYNLLYSSINLPIQKKKITVLKSPHVNKKARDQFEICMSNSLVILKGFAFDLTLYHTLKKIELEDVFSKLTISTQSKNV